MHACVYDMMDATWCLFHALEACRGLCYFPDRPSADVFLIALQMDEWTTPFLDNALPFKCSCHSPKNIPFSVSRINMIN